MKCRAWPAADAASWPSWDTDLLPDALSGLNDLDIFSFDDVLPLAATAGKTDPDDIPRIEKQLRTTSRKTSRPDEHLYGGRGGGHSLLRGSLRRR